MATQPARAKTMTYLIGIVGLTLVAFVVYLAATAHTGLPWTTTTTVKAAFNNTASLKVGDQVREYSARIGKVSDIEFVDDRAVVTLELDGERDVYADAAATILDFSALSQKFVDLDTGTPEAGTLGDTVIPAERNVDSVDLYELLNVFDEQTLGSTQSALQALGGATGHGRDLHDLIGVAPDLLSDLGSASGALASEDADLPALLQATDRLSARFVDRGGDIEATVRQFGETLDAFAVDGAEPLRQTLRDLPATLDQANEAFVALDAPLADTQAAFADLRPGFEGLGQATPDLRGVFRDGLQPLGKVPGVAEAAEPAVEDLTVTAADARPLAPQVTETFDHLQEPLDVVGPYAPELGYLIVRLHSFVSESVAPGVHYARVNANFGAASATGAIVDDETTLKHNPYPEPGEATFDRVEGPGGN